MNKFYFKPLMALGFATFYVLLFKISDYLFGNLVVANVAGLVFLPAFIRLLGFLLIGFWIVPALFLAGVVVLIDDVEYPGSLIISGFLAVGGPLGTAIAMHFSGLKPTLSNLSSLRLLVLSIGCSAGNTLFYQLGLYAAGIPVPLMLTTVSVFVGDVIGIWAIIYILKLMLSSFGPALKS